MVPGLKFSASTIPQVGSITMWVNSTTRKPVRGSGSSLGVGHEGVFQAGQLK
jgi:hypothetical protein